MADVLHRDEGHGLTSGNPHRFWRKWGGRIG